MAQEKGEESTYSDEYIYYTICDKNKKTHTKNMSKTSLKLKTSGSLINL